MQLSVAQESTPVAPEQRNSLFSLETKFSVGSSNLCDQLGSPTNHSEAGHLDLAGHRDLVSHRDLLAYQPLQPLPQRQT